VRKKVCLRHFTQILFLHFISAFFFGIIRLLDFGFGFDFFLIYRLTSADYPAVPHHRMYVAKMLRETILIILPFISITKVLSDLALPLLSFKGSGQNTLFS